MPGDEKMPTALHPQRRLTYDDLIRLPDDGLRHEIIDGVHYVSASPALRHQVLVGRLHFAIEQHLRAHAAVGQVFLAPVDVVLSNHDVVGPDLLLVLTDRAGILTPKNVQGAPSLVIEVVSPSTRSRDVRLKRDLYERSGVSEYWLVDPESSELTRLRRESSGLFGPAEAFRAADVLETPLLAGFRLHLTELFA